jgi:hypothetical protein
MAELNVTELDFDTIKNNLRNYLAAQPEFTDYDFTGSALSVLLDVLAYNTHYNAVLANLQVNEMFIDTAIKRTSVVSLAKMLGYSPRSTTSAKALVNLQVTKNSESNETTLSISPSVKFNASINGRSYTFNVNESQTATVNNNKFVFTDVELIEGIYLSNTFLIGADNSSGPLIIPNNNIDTSTLRVYVQNSSSDVTSTDWIKTSNIVDITNTSKVFWVEESNEGDYQVVFGDDVFGARLTPGNIVTITYLVSEGESSNGARVFTLVGDIDGEDEVDITILTPATGGTQKETIDSIRFNAPRYNANRNRAVTSQDYRTLIKQNFPKAREITVWGGEENIPPIYGTVFISIDPTIGSTVTQSDKDYISETILRPRSIMSIKHQFVDPDYVYLGLEGVVNYDPKLTSFKASDLSVIVKTEIENYFDVELGTLDKTFFLSVLSDRVKKVNSAIVSSVFKMRLQKRLSIGIGSSYSNVVNFLTAIDPGTLKSSNFVTTYNGLRYEGYLQDFSLDEIQNDEGTGVIKFIDKLSGKSIGTFGTVNYAQGTITLTNVNLTTYLGNLNELYFSCRPQPLFQNITSSVVRTSDISQFAIAARPARNSILTLDTSSSNAAANITPGLIINCKPYSIV